MQQNEKLLEEREGYISSELSPPSVGRIVPAKYWNWTHNYVGESPATKMEAFFKTKGWQYYFGHETAPTTGHKHLKGWLGYTQNIRPNEGHELVRKTTWFKSGGSYDQNIAYCSKEATDIRTNIPRIPKPLIDPMEGFTPYEWQQQVLDIIFKEKVNPGNIYWFWEPTGNVGKTSLTKHILMRNKTVLALTGKSINIKQG